MKLKNMKLRWNALSIAAAITLTLFGCGSGSGPENSVAPTGKSASSLSAAPDSTNVEIDPTEILPLSISVKLNDSDGLDKYVAEINDPQSPNYRKTLTLHEVIRRFGPKPERIEKIKKFLAKSGFSNIDVSSSSLLIHAQIPVGVASNLFSTTVVKHAHKDGSFTYKNTASIKIGFVAQMALQQPGWSTGKLTA